MTFDIIEAEQTQSSLLNSTVFVTEKEIAVKEDKATQTYFRSIDMGAAEVNQDDENVVKSDVDLEQKALMNNDKTEQKEHNKKKGSVEKDEEQPDETQEGQGIVVSEYAQEELKTNDEAEELESGLTHREMIEKPLDEDQLEVKNENTNAEEMLDNTMSQAEPDTPKEQLEHDRDKVQDSEEPLKCECDPSAGSKELDEEETALCSSTTFDAKLVFEEPAMEENKTFTPEADFDPILSEVLPSGELNTNTENNVLGHLKAKVTRLHDKEHSMKSKAQKVLEA